MLKRLAVAALPIAVVAIVVLPIALDQPFGTQTPRLMAWLYALRRWSPLVAAAGAAAMLVIAVRAWPRSRIVAQAALTAAVAVTIAAACPIRQMAYHHLVNDRIGRTPAVVTY